MPDPLGAEFRLGEVEAGTTDARFPDTRSSAPPEIVISSSQAASEGLQRFPSSDRVHNIALREDIAPDGGYGWVVTACVFLVNAHTWGVNSAWGVFLARFLSDATFPAATHLEYALIGGMSTSLALAISPLVGLTNEKLGTRIALLIGTVLVSVSMLASSYATRVWHLFLSQSACFGFGMGFLYITASNILPQWFTTRRSLAVGLASSGAGVGGLVYNLGAGAALERFGWRWTYVGLAISTLVINLACAFLLKDRHDNNPRNRSAWKSFDVGAMLNLGLAVGRPAIGYFSDRFGRINLATLMTALCGVFCLTLWVPARSYAGLVAFALCAGTVTGIFWSTASPVTAEVVGLRRLPGSFGMICLPLVLPATFAESIALQLVATSGFESAKVFVGGTYLIAALCAWSLRAWKIHALEGEDAAAQAEWPSRFAARARPHNKIWLNPRGLLSLRKV